MTNIIESAIANGIATITLNRPDKMNALSLDMWRALGDRMAALNQDPSLRCVVVRGAGSHFAAGADLAEFRDLRWTADQAAIYGGVMIKALYGLRDCPYPTIAAIDGNCIGGGLEIAAMCDLRLATPRACFGIPIQRIGVTMPYPELLELVRLLGRATMLELLLEGGIYPASWALAKGLVTRLCGDGDLDRDVAELTRRIITGSPLSHRNHKRMIRRCEASDSLTQAEIREIYAACETADYREGIAAFLERRRPNFTGT